MMLPYVLSIAMLAGQGNQREPDYYYHPSGIVMKTEFITPGLFQMIARKLEQATEQEPIDEKLFGRGKEICAYGLLFIDEKGNVADGLAYDRNTKAISKIMNANDFARMSEYVCRGGLKI